MLRRKRPLSNKRGFLLLEVLVSIAVISIGLIYVVRSFSSSTKAIEASGRFLKSVSLIEDKLWDLEAKGVIEKGRDEGRFKEDDQYRWIIEAEGAKEIPINHLELKVVWEGPQKSQKISTETYLWNEED